jgi:hypothetical protein
LAGFAAGTLLFLFLVRAGGLLVQRERASMRTDLTAYSIGVDYARALNVLTLSEKIVSTGEVASFLPVVGGSAQVLVRFLQKVQKYFLEFGPWMNEASAAYMGLQNGLIAVPLWNTRDLIQDLGVESILPAYNVEVRGLLGLITEALNSLLKTKIQEKVVAQTIRGLEQKTKETLSTKGVQKIQSLLKKSLPGVDLSWLFKKTGYSYQPKDGKPRVFVAEEEGTTQLERKSGGGHIDRSHDDRSGKKVHIEHGFALDLPVDLEETGKHFITLIAPTVPALEPLARPGQPWIWSVAQVQVDGGDMHTFSMHSCEYRPRFVPVRIGIKLPKSKMLNITALSYTEMHHQYSETEVPGRGPDEASLTDVREALDLLPFDVSRLPGGGLIQTAFDILDIQH